MQLGMIGLGRMGAHMTERLIGGGHRVVGYDRNPQAVEAVTAKGVLPASSLKDLVAHLQPPRIIWIMVPAGPPVDQTIGDLVDLVAPEDILIDGGNSNYKDTLRRSQTLEQRGIRFIDVGTSGGIWGLKEGYCLMIGGDDRTVTYLTPLFETLAPAANLGWGHVGPPGAGHFVKMVHNGIEYGLMEAYAEGFALMHSKSQFNLELAQVARIWQHSSVIRSWLLDLLAGALQENPDLDDIAPYVPDSGEGRWTVEEAIELNIPVPVITLSLLERLRSRLGDSYADKLLAALRHQFGGHPIKKSDRPTR